MLEKIVQVIFRGKNDVGAPAKQATDEVEGFSKKAGSFLKGLGAAAAALGLASFFKTAVEEAQTSREAMAQLANVVDNSGASFRAMAPDVYEALNGLARLTKFGDDEFAEVMRDMVLRTGDAGWSLRSLGLTADLAAAAQIPLADAGKLLANAHEGNTKALFKLIPELKGAANWEEILAQKTAGAAEEQMRALGPIEAAKKQFGEFAESVGKAILGNESFSTSGFGVAEMLAGLAGWVDDNSAAIGEFIDALVLAGRNVVEGFTPAFTLLRRVAGPVLSLLVVAVTEMSFAFRAGTVVIEEFAGQVYQDIGKLVQRVGAVLKLLGVEVVSTMGLELQKFGETLDREASARWDKLVVDQRAFLGKLKGDGDKHVGDVQTQERAKVRIVKQALDETEGDYRKQLAAIEQTYKLLNSYVVEYKKQLATLNPAIRAALDKDHAERFAETWQRIDGNARTLIDRMKANPLPPLVQPATAAVAEMGTTLANAAGNVLDVADNFGGLDQDAKSVLGTVQNLASTVATLATKGLSFAGVAGVLGGVASIVSTMMQGDKERRDLTRKNTEVLRELVTDGVKLSTKVSGETLTGVGAALGGLNLAALAGLESAPGDKGYTQALNLLVGQLAKSGLRLSDLDAVAGELGLSIRRSNGAIDMAQLQSLLLGLQTNMSAFTRVGQSFGEQLKFFKDTQRLEGVSGADQFAALGGFVRSVGRVGALQGIDFTDAASARGSLLALFRQLNNGGLDASQLGGLTGDQFRDVLDELLSLANALETDAVRGVDLPGAGLGAALGAPADLGSLPTADVVTGTGATVEGVLLGRADDVVGLLTAHRALLERTAVAGEGSFATLLEIRDLAVALGRGRGAGTDRVDDRLAALFAVERRVQGDATL